MTWQDNYQIWADRTDLPANLQADMQQLATDDKAAEDAFYQPLSFGTAGMRGILGAGINRMNIFTVRQATEGLVLRFLTIHVTSHQNLQLNLLRFWGLTVLRRTSSRRCVQHLNCHLRYAT